MATIEDVRALGSTLERSYEVIVRGRLKFRVAQLVYVAFSRDERTMEFAFPKEMRDGLIGGQPEKFRLPAPSDLRFNWVSSDLEALDAGEAREFVVDAWRMVVPQKVSRAYDLAHPNGPG
ncbi:MmcQ/YjbR family DNA-binding protein [Microbacterium jejuense]